MSEVRFNEFYCPRCLHTTGTPDYVPEDDYLRRFDRKPGECVECYFNLKIHTKYERIGTGKITTEERQAFLDDPARKADPRFDQEAYNKRVNYVPIQYEDLLAEAERDRNGGRSPVVVKCPYCHSKNTRKISGISKAWNTALFGVFGNKRRQQWHCGNCGSDF